MAKMSRNTLGNFANQFNALRSMAITDDWADLRRIATAVRRGEPGKYKLKGRQAFPHDAAVAETARRTTREVSFPGIGITLDMGGGEERGTHVVPGVGSRGGEQARSAGKPKASPGSP